MQSPPADVPQGAPPDQILTLSDRKKKHKERSKEESDPMEKNALYDIVSSPKDSTKLTLKLSRVKVQDVDQSEELPPEAHMELDHETVMINNNNNNQLSKPAQEVPNKLGADDQANCQQAAVRSNTIETGVTGRVSFDDTEIDTLAEIERIERESASDRERWSKEVQDKGENPVLLSMFFSSVRLFV